MVIDLPIVLSDVGALTASPWRLTFHRPDGQKFDAWLGLARIEEADFDVTSWLHPTEIGRAESITHQARRSEYLIGHLAAKRALIAKLNETSVNEIAILDGVFGQPIVVGSCLSPGVGIAHSGGWAVALAFDLRHPMGIDIEIEHPTIADVVRSKATVSEVELLNKLCLPDSESYTLLWTMKEALGKVLTTGLMCPLWFYEVDDISVQGRFYKAVFRNFKQYRTLSFMLALGIRCSIVLPGRSRMLLTGSLFDDSQRWAANKVETACVHKLSTV